MREEKCELINPTHTRDKGIIRQDSGACDSNGLGNCDCDIVCLRCSGCFCKEHSVIAPVLLRRNSCRCKQELSTILAQIYILLTIAGMQ